MEYPRCPCSPFQFLLLLLKPAGYIMKTFILFITLTYCFPAFSQNCQVIPPALQGAYDGECKKDKANGKGTATGEDRYDGEFKNGYPEGSGKYTWKNGDWYEGRWKKGLREGQGTLHYTGAVSGDSVIAGFWKKDKYIGSHEQPYLVHNKTSSISRSDVVYNRETSLDEITISIESITGGVTSISGPIPKIEITDISIISGQYMNKVDNNNLPRTFISALKSVQFPFRARFSMGADMIEIEFFEKGSYSVDIKIQR